MFGPDHAKPEGSFESWAMFAYVDSAPQVHVEPIKDIEDEEREILRDLGIEVDD